ncbi:phosphatase [Levilactobacillus senmaizukei DSM 21775 = NBRC 103853]|uniref:Phosphatase n=1 Tax=Levilactobacillus senmaizukei DSM 21775 = NBRC 103853 TaxID=1423803 RepID=A0A0R2DCL7_9LACO|nr:HAD family hydrolase [Levilactobacillus senmaizukei]KRN01650.1 phosphatase [Levilactobacillus senmaizukei DSM 21775 = NBRC 103853]
MQTYIFDIDGTLMDTEAMYMRALQAVLREAGDPRPYAELTATFGIPSRDALEDLHVANLEHVLAAWGERTAAYRETVRVYPGVLDTLDQLRRKGAQLAIMTSKRQFEYERDVVPSGLADHFSLAIVAEDVKRGKPAPDGINLAMQRLNADPATTIYIGDTHFDQAAAQSANVAFGYAAWNDRQPRGFTPTISLTTPRELITKFTTN